MGRSLLNSAVLLDAMFLRVLITRKLVTQLADQLVNRMGTGQVARADPVTSNSTLPVDASNTRTVKQASAVTVHWQVKGEKLPSIRLRNSRLEITGIS